MMRTHLLSMPGGAKPNEDFALATPEMVLVLDGVTSPPNLGTGCQHGTPWYVRRLAANLIGGATARPGLPLADVLGAAIDATRSDHRGQCDLGHPGTPSATVALLRRAEDQVDYLVLSDATVVVDRIGQPTRAISDLRVDAIEPDLQAEVKATPYGTPEREALTEKWVSVQRLYRNVEGGYPIAGAQPSAAWKAETGSVRLDSLVRIGTLSDGASCYTDLYKIGDWTQALDAMDQDMTGFLRTVREHEDLDPDCSRWPRWKRHDDATAALLQPEPPARRRTTPVHPDANGGRT
jgi:hypothetical protein